MTTFEVDPGRVRGLTGELCKLPAFVRRDWLLLRTYTAAFASDLLFIGVQARMFG